MEKPYTYRWFHIPTGNSGTRTLAMTPELHAQHRHHFVKPATDADLFILLLQQWNSNDKDWIYGPIYSPMGRTECIDAGLCAT